jgi:two-component system LytT family sensor kinase
MKKNKNINFWLLYYPVVLTFSILSAMFIRYNLNGEAFVPETILTASVIFTISILGGHLAIYFKNRAAELSHSVLNKKIVGGFIIFLVCIFIIVNFVVSLGGFVWYVVNGMDLNNFLPNLFKYDLSYANKSLFIWLMLISIAFFYVLWRMSSKKEQKLQEENLKFRYQTLKSQVNPHFLFNSFNTLSELVFEDAKKADSYIQKLSAIYRYVIENEETELIELEKEIDFVKEYFGLQKERYKDKISLNINISDTSNYKIVPLSLQLLVENAVKHNSASVDSPLIINILRDSNEVVVSNNIQKRNIIEGSTKTGLQNLKERVRLSINKELIFKEENNSFIVKIPIYNTGESFNNRR